MQPTNPEASSGYSVKKDVYAKQFMAVTAHPLATQAAQNVLRRGGHAVDAAIAAQMVLGLVEPQSSGIGGGALMLAFDAKTGQTIAWDGRETAPASATPDLFMQHGKLMNFGAAVVGGRSVGVPSVVKMLQSAHQKYGKLPWPSLFTPAIDLARDGFTVGKRWYLLVQSEPYLRQDIEAAKYFYQSDGTPHAVGAQLRNPAYAATLATIATQGAQAFYNGPLAQRIVDKVRNHPTNPGGLTLLDLQNYQAVQREPVCTRWRALHVCGFGPPSSGAIAIGQMLTLLESVDIAQQTPYLPNSSELNPQAVHWIGQAGRLAFADRNAYVADADFVDVPVAGLLDPNYLRERAALMALPTPGQAQPGSPKQAVSMGLDASPELPGTSHISIVDRWGNAVSMTTTIEDQYGSRMMVDGYLLNNQLTDFSFLPEQNGKLVANRVQAGKRPRSSMSPTLVFADQHGKRGELVAVIGSPGGSQIIGYVTKTLMGVFAWGLSMQQAIDLPNFGSRNTAPNGVLEIEKSFLTPALEQALIERGNQVKAIEMTSGIHGIRRLPKGQSKRQQGWFWEGGADPRREGVVGAD